MSIVDNVRKLCTPAYVYLMISIVAIIALMFQNAGNTDRYCIGVYECHVDNTAMMFLGKGLYVLFWTYVLNAICRAGYKGISWFLVLFPFLFFFVLLGMLMVLTIQEPMHYKEQMNHLEPMHYKEQMNHLEPMHYKEQMNHHL